jgi:hypothetical protein
MKMLRKSSNSLKGLRRALEDHLPHPDCKRLAVFTLSTTAVGRCDQYRAILRHIAALATFENPLVPTTPEVP